MTGDRLAACIAQYALETGRDDDWIVRRTAEAASEVRRTGTYTQTSEEVAHPATPATAGRPGARTAGRTVRRPPRRRDRVRILHPELDWFEALDIVWHALPAISCMRLDAFGVSYPAAPFSGWYMGTEIGARNLSDVDRYNLLPRIARGLGLDVSDDYGDFDTSPSFAAQPTDCDPTRPAGSRAPAVRMVDG